MILMSRNPLEAGDRLLTSYPFSMRPNILGAHHTSLSQMSMSIESCAPYPVYVGPESEFSHRHRLITRNQSNRRPRPSIRLRRCNLVKATLPRQGNLQDLLSRNCLKLCLTGAFCETSGMSSPRNLRTSIVDSTKTFGGVLSSELDAIFK